MITHSQFPVNLAAAIVAGILVIFAVPSLIYFLLRRTGCTAHNYRGDLIPVMFGLSIVLSSLLLLGIVIRLLPGSREIILRWVVLVIGFGILGFIDDKWGDKKVKGLRGHLRAALLEHRVTTGLLKAIGGLGIGLFLALWLFQTNYVRVTLAGAIIALSANCMNLLDLRPGRAGAVFIAGSSAILAGELCLHEPHIQVLLLGCIAIPALPAWLLDSRGRVMLGDTGSNVLGAALGFATVETNNLYLQTVVIALLIVMHITAERRSITEIISRNPMLNALDRMTGVRD